MFTRDFSKLRQVIIAVFTLALIYSVININLLIASYWAERYTNAYPYKSEDWLRYLLPSRFEDRGRNWIMLAGPSAVRENFLYERFDNAFAPMRTFQEALSLGTIDDLLIALSYIKKVYGVDVLPEILVLGVTPRFVANIPEHRPFINGINLYSYFYSVEQNSDKLLYLAPRGWLGAVRGKMRFLMFKQQGRYRTAVAAIMNYFLGGDSSLEEILKRDEQGSNVGSFSDNVLNKIRKFVYFGVSPYKYHNLQPLTQAEINEWLLDPESWWSDVHTWDPKDDELAISRNFNQLLAFTSRHRIRIYVVNLPENNASRRLYNPENYQSYLEILKKSLQGTPLLDLRMFLNGDEFYDIVHARFDGAIRITDRVIDFIINDSVNQPKN